MIYNCPLCGYSLTQYRRHEKADEVAFDHFMEHILDNHPIQIFQVITGMFMVRGGEIEVLKKAKKK